ncbi:beta-1,4-galactosyltransferase 2-like isoform X2 [Lampetra planeri]
MTVVASSLLRFIAKLFAVLCVLQLGWLLVVNRRVPWFRGAASSLILRSQRVGGGQETPGEGRGEGEAWTTMLMTNWPRTSAEPVRVLARMNSEGGGTERRNGTSAASEMCPDFPPALLGPMNVQVSSTPSLESVSQSNPLVSPGGSYRPDGCLAQQRVAVVIPFRARERHLALLLKQLHPMLQRQQAHYSVYVVTQAGNGIFNRAKLMNVGYVEALRDASFDCFIFSDVDLIPLDDRNLYRCGEQPQHLTVAVDKFDFRLPYLQSFGGVSALSRAQFKTINGFSNLYWGWGGEDDDFFRRFNLIRRAVSRMKWDGLNSLHYLLVKRTMSPLYTNLTVNIGGPQGSRL